MSFEARAFLVIYRAVGFARTTEELRVARPTMSRRVRFLRGRCSTELFSCRGGRLCVASTKRVLGGQLVAVGGSRLILGRRVGKGRRGRRSLSLKIAVAVKRCTVMSGLTGFLLGCPRVGLRVRCKGAARLLALLSRKVVGVTLMRKGCPGRGCRREECDARSCVTIYTASRGFRTKVPSSVGRLLRRELLIQRTKSKAEGVLRRLLVTEKVGVRGFGRCIRMRGVRAVVNFLGGSYKVSFVCGITMRRRLRGKVLGRVRLSSFGVRRSFSFV